MSSESLHKNCDDEDNTFDWTKYLKIRCAEEVPEDFFCHVCKSEQNGIELGSIIEVENEDCSGYWFASVTLSKGVLICLRYYGDENDTNDFWIVIKSPRIHNLNWGNENGKELIPPHPERFQRVNIKVMKEKILDCEHIVSEKVLQLEGAPIFNVFKPGMCVEIQDRDYPYRVWISKILNNVGGRLLLEMLGDDSPEKEPFWLFYLNERVFPMGWAEQKGLPWRVINPSVDLNDTIDSNVLLNVLKPQTPKQHSYKLGEVLEVLSPHSLMIFYTAKIIKIYDNRYFKIEVNDNHNVDKRFTFLATKENPYLFNAGWANKHKLVLKPPFDWDSELPFNWLEYIKKNNLKFATIDKICQKNIECIKVGMKLEAVDPVYPDKIRIATIKEVLNHWIILTFDRSNWYQELLHVRSIYSDEIFPVGWCNKHKYTLSSPQSLYINCDTYISYYYKSDFEINLNDEDIDDLTKCNFYVKNDFYFHSKHKDSKLYEDIGLENTYIDNKPDLKNDLVIPHTMLKTEVLNHEISELENKSKSEEFKLVQKIKADDILKSSPSFKSNVNKKFYIHFNKDCYPGNHTVKRKITALPNNIGPGFVSKVLQEAISIFVSLDYYPWVALKKIKKLQHLLYNEPGGVVKMVSTKATKFHEKHVEYLLLPESKKLAQIYCATLCNLSGMCENFMTTIKTQCSHGCKLKALKTLNKSFVDSAITEKSKVKNSVDKNKEKTESLIEKICKVAKLELDCSNQSLVERYKYYLACIVNYESYIIRLNNSLTPLELAILTECESKKEYLKTMDRKNTNNCINITYKINEDNNYFHTWKLSFEKIYREDPRFKNIKIDIGHFEVIKVTSNPKYWSSEDVYCYLSNDPYCKILGKTMIALQVDGVAFMLLNEEQLIKRLRCSINLALRMMCHIAEVKFTFLKDYKNT